MRAAAVLLFLAVPAAAQMPAMPVFEAHSRTYGLRLGLAAPTATNGLSGQVGRGPAVTLQHLRYPIDWIAYGAELSIQSLGKKTATINGLPSTGKGSATNLSGLLRLNFLQNRSYTPYILSGIGWHSASFPGGKSSAMTVTAGLGYEIFIVQNLSVVLETRFHSYMLDRKKFAGNAEVMSYLLGVNIWRF